MRKQARNEKLDEVDLRYGVEWAAGQQDVIGWVANIKTHSVFDENERERQVLLLFLGTDDGRWLKCQYEYAPYFLVECQQEMIDEGLIYIENRFERNLSKVEIVHKLDLDMDNHLAGNLKKFLRLSFLTISDLIVVRNQLKSQIEKNKDNQRKSVTRDPTKYFTDIREYDVPYHCRVCIDTGIRCGKWFKFTLNDRLIMKFEEAKEMVGAPQLNYMSYDIETSKLPLRFPDSKTDSIMMISLQYENHAVLITNKERVKQEVYGFDYAPKEEYRVDVEVFNEDSELELLQRFFKIILEYKPLIITSFNGDKFDWPFIEERCSQLRISIEDEIGVRRQDEAQEYFGRFVCHLDCFNWVERDAFLPQGSHGLKAVSEYKLGYKPVEVDPEQMVPMAERDSQRLAEYSVSDAVATYHLYKKHIHDFIFALCTIIPLSPDEVLRKGSGTLCECLLMAMAYNNNIVFPNKKKEALESFHNGHLLDSETYIGGKVECLRSGVYRKEFPQEFKIDKECIETLYRNVEQLIDFMVKIEGKEVDTIEKQKCAAEIRAKLDTVMSKGSVFKDVPLIYHLDVAAMYPNIILTNRLQPVSIVDPQKCSQCQFNNPENRCKRDLEWQWKGTHFPINKSEYETIKRQITQDLLDQGKKIKDIPQDQLQKIIKQRVKLQSQKIYKTVHQHTIQLKKNTVCMRENDFYVQTVRDFRDRRYEFKEAVKIWKIKFEEAAKQGDLGGQADAKNRMAFYDSQQLAHKIILNSFYGYVMRRGARWYSMEMAAMVTHIGSSIISTARQLVEKIGLPLELDTDGIWCMLPNGFPEDFTIKDTRGKTFKWSYPCFMLNELVYEKYNNDQYQRLVDPKNFEYEIRNEMSIFFEVDGPYKCMMIPAAREEDKQLKKRYVVYHQNGKIAELKGFEIKRRGELQIIKNFQKEIFSAFVLGNTLQECYQECGKVAANWLRLLEGKGEGIDDKELVEYIGESKILSKDVNSYENLKGVAITAGKRMAEFLGAASMKGPGICCTYIISAQPNQLPVTERAIPITIFETDPDVRARYLRKWLKDPGLKEEDLEMRQLIDWNYYIERFNKTLQKIIVIPALLQHQQNPLPQVQPPDWLIKRLKEMNSGLQQQKLGAYFVKQSAITNQFASIRHQTVKPIMELEDIGKSQKKVFATPIKVTAPIMMKNAYNMDTQFKPWLQTQKKIWDAQIRAKKAITKSQMKENFKPNNIMDHIHLQTQNLIGSVWQILQVYEMEPGIFQMWILLENGSLHSVSITVPRTLYVHSFKQEPNRPPLKRILPREKQLHFLYEIMMEEKRFQQEYGSFKDYLSNPNYENIYEVKIPLLFRLVTELGSLCRLKGSNLKNINLNDLNPVDELPNRSQYLACKEYDLINKFLCIQHIQIFKSDLWAVFSPVTNEFTFVFVGKIKQPEQYRYVIKEALKQLEGNLYSEGAKIKVVALEDNRLACTYLETLSLQLKQQRVTQSQKLCVIQSNFSQAYLQSLGLRFPCMDMPALFINQPELQQLHPVGWQEKAIKFLIQQYQLIPKALEQQLTLSRFCSIPIFNVQRQDYLNNLTDVLYSRYLKKEINGISWYGNTEKDLKDLIPTDFQSSQYIQPGLYMSFCVEINIQSLVVNTIAQFDELRNIDKEVLQIMDTIYDSYDELAGAKTAFKVLRVLVLGCLELVYNIRDQTADDILTNICRWVFSGTSPLYDHQLTRIIKRLSYRVFTQLQIKLQQLGAKIIYASIYKIIISTGKQKYEEAKSYTEYILEDICRQPLFKYLLPNITRYYTNLIFKDSANYIGYTHDGISINELNLKQFLPKKLIFIFEEILNNFIDTARYFRENTLEELKTKTTREQVHQVLQLESSIISHLSEYIEDQLAPMLYQLVTKLQESYNQDRKKSKQVLNFVPLAEEEDYSTMSEEARSQPFEQDEDYEKNSFLADDDERIQYQQFDDLPDEEAPQKPKKLDFEEANNEGQFQNLQSVERQIEEEQENPFLRTSGQDSWEPPERFGMKEQHPNPIGQMIVYLAELIGLDDRTEVHMRTLKSNCFKLLQLSEYSREAEYHDPCITLVLPDLVCENCYSVHGLDVFRSEWVCPICSVEYLDDYVEDKLVKFMEQWLSFYQIQDLYCARCKQVQEDPLALRCFCSGQYVTRLDQFPNELMSNFPIYRENLLRLSSLKGFKYLENILQQ